MEALLLLFAFGGWGFYVLVTLGFLIVSTLVGNDRGKLATASLVVLLGYVWFASTEPLAWVLAHWQVILATLCAYYGGGIVYTYLRWRQFVQFRITLYINAKRAFLTARGIEGTVIPSTLAPEFLTGPGRGLGQPMVYDFKSDITMWLTYWPFALVGNIVFDFFLEMIAAIYRYISGSLQRVSDRAWAKANL